MTEILWGVDLGGTKIELVVARRRELLTPLFRERRPTEAERGYEAIVSTIGELVHDAAQRLGEKPFHIGFGTPGVIDPRTTLLKNSNTQCLNGKPLTRDLTAWFVRYGMSVAPQIANDANCFALAEALLGAGKGAHSVFGVILGTGVGGGLVIDEQVVHGAQGIAGEWGHNVIEPHGPPCYCGKNGCVERLIAGPRLEERYQALTRVHRSLAEIVAREPIDDAAREVITFLVTIFGRALGVVINIVDPHVIVLGGGVSNISALYDRGVEELRRTVFNDRLETQVVRHALGDSAGVFGAALLSDTKGL